MTIQTEVNEAVDHRLDPLHAATANMPRTCYGPQAGEENIRIINGYFASLGEQIPDWVRGRSIEQAVQHTVHLIGKLELNQMKLRSAYIMYPEDGREKLYVRLIGPKPDAEYQLEAVINDDTLALP